MTDQVLCIRDDWVPPRGYPVSPIHPVKGQVYTVNWVESHRCCDAPDVVYDFFVLWEIFGHVWRTDHFRKCRPTDISCFKTKVEKGSRWKIREKEDA